MGQDRFPIDTMPDLQSPRIFISYSRKDGGELATELRKKLLAENLSLIWQDIVALESGRDWWSQIEDALRSKALQHFVLIVTPTALASSVVRDEIRLARKEGKAVSTIKGPGLGDLNKLPRWVGQLSDIDLPEHWDMLVRTAASKGKPNDTLSDHHVPPAGALSCSARRALRSTAASSKLLTRGTGTLRRPRCSGGWSRSTRALPGTSHSSTAPIARAPRCRKPRSRGSTRRLRRCATRYSA
jgi:hypothetical protein